MKDNLLNRKFKYTFSNASIYLVAANVLVYFLTNYLGVAIKGIPLRYWLGLIPVCVKAGYVWQFVTYMFVHSDTIHIFFNMYALLMFGTNVERAVGTREFLLYYFVCGIFGGIACYFGYQIAGFSNTLIMGASGSVYALLFLSAVLFPTNRVLLFFFIPMKLSLAVLIFIIIEAVEQVTGSADGVAHLIHLSSIVAGFIYCIVRFRISPFKVFREALKR